MLENEVLAVLIQERDRLGSAKEMSRIHGIPYATLYNWLTKGYGIRSLPLFQLLDKMKVHLRIEGDEPVINIADERERALTQENAVLKARLEGLKAQYNDLKEQNNNLLELLKKA